MTAAQQKPCSHIDITVWLILKPEKRALPGSCCTIDELETSFKGTVQDC